MKINARGLDLIKKCEGLRLEAYQDSVGVWTIGWGHTGPEVRNGLKIPKGQAEGWLLEDCEKAENCIKRNCKDVLDSMNESQFSALVSFVFNVGCTAFSRSSMLKFLKKKDWRYAAMEFDRWVYAGKRKLPGLVTRRAMEKALFVTGRV